MTIQQQIRYWTLVICLGGSALLAFWFFVAWLFEDTGWRVSVILVPLYLLIMRFIHVADERLWGWLCAARDSNLRAFELGSDSASDAPPGDAEQSRIDGAQRVEQRRIAG